MRLREVNQRASKFDTVSHFEIGDRRRFERRTGELLRETAKNKGACGNPGGRGAKIVRSTKATTQPTLSDHGISKDHNPPTGKNSLPFRKKNPAS
jgi:hypothetical protein